VILDSSAILAILFREPRFDTFVEKLASASTAGVGAPTLAETGIVLSARLGADSKRALSLFLIETELTIISFGEAHWRSAMDAYRRYGKGHHRAGLNFGDCLTYAVAKLAGQPLLCAGADFAKTDLPLA
jgi:ribonuclease VapC